MKWDDYTLVVSASKGGAAEGELYVDDGDSFDFEKGQYVYRKFSLKGNSISSVDGEGRDAKSITPGAWLKGMNDVRVDKIIIVGAPVAWDKKEVKVESEGLTWTAKVQYQKAEKGRAAYAIVGRVDVRIGQDWTVKVA
jgi:mannosyl-oligosaccharide alpha-1,3-glucosidase